MSQPVNAVPPRESPQQEDLSGPPAANRHRLPDVRVIERFVAFEQSSLNWLRNCRDYVELKIMLR